LFTAPHITPNGGKGNGSQCYELALEYFSILKKLYVKKNQFSKVFDII
jgi:hypothetical protein